MEVGKQVSIKTEYLAKDHSPIVIIITKIIIQNRISLTLQAFPRFHLTRGAVFLVIILFCTLLRLRDCHHGICLNLRKASSALFFHE